ncbi:MAG TPA: bifunctional DNA-formamidopyrimidine glycosylase/DNA-(apurinic or apyrimidinic site) lyase [Patescibacteria group bacterium]|nr:bifunctional DNA-formamidopyrimidine glycosylase/DNA-(apurinic or apyrimidinic site) lyase [Patescibacteria group bacterium]
MPELPEVETIKRDLSKLIVGHKILGITTDSPKQVQPSLTVVKKAIVGAKVKRIKRRAKLLQIFLSNGQILAIHLKMTGRLLVRKKDFPKDDWQHVIISLSGNQELRFADLRKFGWVKLIKDKKELEKLLAEFGPEPLDDLDLKKFRAILASSGRPVKIILMDQKKISGVGNIYANDALFLAKIDPRRPAKKISDQEAKKLLQVIEKVLKAGIKYRGASDQYYLDALGRKGAYQEHFLTYGREGKKCFDCDGKVKKIKLGGRGTFFCPKCQK